MKTLPLAGDALARFLDGTGSMMARRKVRHGTAAARRNGPDARTEQSAFSAPPENTTASVLHVPSISIADTVDATIWLAAGALGDWDRPESPTDVHSRQHQLLRALVLAGRITELLRDDATWAALTTDARPTGGRLDEAIAGYEWAMCAPGGLRAAARLCGSPVLFAVWCDEPWWLNSGDLDPIYLRQLAGQPVAEFVRDVLAAAAETLSRQSRFVGSSTKI